MILTPVFLFLDELSKTKRVPVKPLLLERKGLTGLRCEFCNRYYTKLGFESWGVRQVEVNSTGKPGKRDSGNLVWQCWLCERKKITQTVEGLKLVVYIHDIQHIPKDKARERIHKVIVDNLFREIRYSSFWR